jgi:hypothetical protein
MRQQLECFTEKHIIEFADQFSSLYDIFIKMEQQSVAEQIIPHIRQDLFGLRPNKRKTESEKSHTKKRKLQQGVIVVSD